MALDANLELMKKTGQLDVYEYAKTLVNSRPHLIDSVDQYTFIYDALAEVRVFIFQQGYPQVPKVPKFLPVIYFTCGLFCFE